MKNICRQQAVLNPLVPISLAQGERAKDKGDVGMSKPNQRSTFARLVPTSSPRLPYPGKACANSACLGIGLTQGSYSMEETEGLPPVLYTHSDDFPNKCKNFNE